jgi:hypothetical protein
MIRILHLVSTYKAVTLRAYSRNLGRQHSSHCDNVGDMKSVVILFFEVLLLLGLTSRQNRLQIVTIHDDPARFVRLEVDHTVGGNHSHPAKITTEEMTAVLAGMIIDEPRHFIPFRSKGEEPPRHPAFKAAEIDFFAPLLAKGLGTATPEEIVTFYQSSQQTTIVEKVTSGGMFINGDELHVILGNYRSPTRYAPDPGIGATADGRSTPLLSIAPQETKLDFEPRTAIVSSRKGFWSKLFRPERREIIVLFKMLTGTTSDMGRNPN